MYIELEFLDRTKTRVHENDIIGDSSIPFPNVGEKAHIEGHFWLVEERDYIYITQNDGSVKMKVSFWCKELE